ncbi:MAG: DUF711 family protein [Ruminococcus flavefaciens]|nr:DUF711 family protein [Ruminococcus flavefaciens]
MIGIRSITYNLPDNYKSYLFDAVQEANIGWKLQKVATMRTSRLNLTPETECNNTMKLKEIANVCSKIGIRWFNVPVDPWKTANAKNAWKFAYNVLKDYDRAFVHILAIQDKKIDIAILRKSAQLIHKVSKIGNTGHENFRLGISCNAVPNTPFFPFTMSSGEFSFSIALELTQEINRIIQKNQQKNLLELREIIIDKLEGQIAAIEQEAERLSQKSGIGFAGFDFSLAPIIEDNGSLWPVLNRLGIKEFGSCGSLFATYYLTDILKSFGKTHKMVGFSGVMYSVLEDYELCSINNDKTIRMENLIAMSTMCGCGLDMIPVHSDITITEIINLILEVAAVSNRLTKPLGIRLLPIPGTYRDTGMIYHTSFSEDADFITNTKLIHIGDNCIPSTGLHHFEFLDRK